MIFERGITMGSIMAIVSNALLNEMGSGVSPAAAPEPETLAVTQVPGPGISLLE